MSKKKLFISALVLLALAALIYLQVRTWRKFDWQKFWDVTRGTSVIYLLTGTALIYADYFLRAVRWKILLRPVCEAQAARLVAPTMIGFTGLALLGRPGEFIRPYLIARKEGLSMSSQVAVWTVERIFDSGAFSLIMALNILIAGPNLKKLPGFINSPRAFFDFQISGLILLAGVTMAALFAYSVRKNPARVAQFSHRLTAGISERAAKAISRRVQAFGEGLNTIKDLKSFAQLSGLSLMIWLIIGLSYVAVTNAYHIHRHAQMTLSNVLLLTAASVVGGVLQLPVVGGGSQLATIGVLHGVFALSPELSTSCGMMLWLVTFMSVIPAGLFLAHREHVSLTRLEEQSEEEIGLSEHPVTGSSENCSSPNPASQEQDSGPGKWAN
ncbi:MAG TPA: lysylphosphatidylglycerol synthase transmembrane domain-containing protein [Candidatus Angelobacter sp.]|nr:lysylphosphatidylglycerol synthase transmembrane domain-containing protein [Candidatus Angelobacter sp.]